MAKIIELAVNAKVRAVRQLDPRGASIKAGTEGVVVAHARADGDETGPLVQWPFGALCNVYEGDVEVLETIEPMPDAEKIAWLESIIKEKEVYIRQLEDHAHHILRDRRQLVALLARREMKSIEDDAMLFESMKRGVAKVEEFIALSTALEDALEILFSGDRQLVLGEKGKAILLRYVAPLANTLASNHLAIGGVLDLLMTVARERKKEGT